MPTEPKPRPQQNEIISLKRVIGTCPDGHETEFDVVAMFAHVGSGTGELCTKPSKIGAGACGKYLKVKEVYGAASRPR